MNRSKKLLLVGMLALSCIIIQPNYTKAALQSNGNAPTGKSVGDWITQIRKMQEPGGGLGLTDTIDETNLTSQNKNFDIHMQKNTEYGAIAILSASSYGNPNKIESGGTTTGNNTGIVMNLNKEWVAAGLTNTHITPMLNAGGRYKNEYAPSYVAKIGDAITETNGWHGSGASSFIASGWIDPAEAGGLIRSYSGSIFSYYGTTGQYLSGGTRYYFDATNWKTWSSRAIVVVGSGI